MAATSKRRTCWLRSLRLPVPWFFAVVTVLAGMSISWFVTSIPTSNAAGTTGTGPSSISVQFVDSSDDPITELALPLDGSPKDVFVAARGMTPGSHDTVQLLIRRDPAQTRIVSAVCSGVFNGAISPTAPVAISPSEIAFECGLQAGVATSNGIAARFTLERLSSGNGELELLADGPFGVRLFSAGVPSQAQPGAALSITEPPLPASVTATTISPTATSPPTGGGGFSGGIGFAPPQVAPAPAFFIPGVPREVNVSAGDGSAELTWLPPLSDGGATITQYVVRSADGGVNLIVPGQSSTARLTDLENGREYRFRVRAINSIGAGPFTDPSGPVTPVGPPSAPLDLTGQSFPSSRELFLEWNPPEQLNGADIESYNVTEATGLIDPVTLAADAISHTFEQVEPGDYTFSVRGGSGCLDSPTRFYKWNRAFVCQAATGSGSGLV